MCKINFQENILKKLLWQFFEYEWIFFEYEWIFFEYEWIFFEWTIKGWSQNTPMITDFQITDELTDMNYV